MQFAEKWDGQRPQDWKRRARRAEAEREAARAIATRALRLDARGSSSSGARRGDRDASWRLTAPLRRLNRLRRGGAR